MALLKTDMHAWHLWTSKPNMNTVGNTSSTYSIMKLQQLSAHTLGRHALLQVLLGFCQDLLKALISSSCHLGVNTCSCRVCLCPLSPLILLPLSPLLLPS